VVVVVVVDIGIKMLDLDIVKLNGDKYLIFSQYATSKKI
jgi:hypothetical protein